MIRMVICSSDGFCYTNAEAVAPNVDETVTLQDLERVSYCVLETVTDIDQCWKKLNNYESL